MPSESIGSLQKQEQQILVSRLQRLRKIALYFLFLSPCAWIIPTILSNLSIASPETRIDNVINNLLNGISLSFIALPAGVVLLILWCNLSQKRVTQNHLDLTGITKWTLWSSALTGIMTGTLGGALLMIYLLFWDGDSHTVVSAVEGILISGLVGMYFGTIYGIMFGTAFGLIISLFILRFLKHPFEIRDPNIATSNK